MNPTRWPPTQESKCERIVARPNFSNCSVQPRLLEQFPGRRGLQSASLLAAHVRHHGTQRCDTQGLYQRRMLRIETAEPVNN